MDKISVSHYLGQQRGRANSVQKSKNIQGPFGPSLSIVEIDREDPNGSKKKKGGHA